MVTDELKYTIRQAFSFPPTLEQERAIGVFADFLTGISYPSVMILRGAAGTGKTTLAAAIVRAMIALKQKIVLLAPTGRAAKVFSLYAGQPAYTIHRRIYRQKSLEGGFTLNYNVAHDTIFIVDEASMISDSGESSLLNDLLQFVYGGQRCRLLLIGDYAQLPPVGETESPALSASCLRGYGFHVYEATLNEVLRQAAESGILYNATAIRHLQSSLPKIHFNGFEDVRVVRGDELIEQLASSYSHAGLDDTIVVTRSNKRANIYNEGIRRTILDREDELSRGDRLMVVKNNYFWSKEKGERSQEEGLEFIANGDIAVVQRFRNVHEQHGFRFAEVTLSFPDYDGYELTATVLLDTLSSEAPALTREQQQQLYERVLADYADIPKKSERMKKVKEDRYYNALQVKFAYAVTCHKAQGGQWEHVYIDQGYMTDDMLTPEYFHWLYTAFTRATEQLYLVNWPKTQVE
jgi:ATP-dependent exoDNAse (exonuclease V) alpha subunit